MARLLIAASGTGGHIFPALAVAETLSSSWEIHWLGVPDRLESKIVPSQYQLVTIPVRGLQGNFVSKVYQFFKLISATKFVISFIKEKNIQILFTTGGYIAAPSILAAKLVGIKVVLHESNALPGRVTRSLGRFCDLVALGLPDACQYLLRSNTLVTGTPVRKSFLTSQPIPNWIPFGKGPLLVVIGGSQGAIGLNRMMRSVLPFFLEKGCRVVHITGTNDPQHLYMQHQNLAIKTFSNEIPGLLQHADLVISRAGAGTVCELAVCGTPAVLVPYPSAKDDHQTINALCAAQFGAAVIVHEHETQHKALYETLDRLLASRLSDQNNEEDLLRKMQEGMQLMAMREAQETLVNILNTLI